MRNMRWRWLLVMFLGLMTPTRAHASFDWVGNWQIVQTSTGATWIDGSQYNPNEFIAIYRIFFLADGPPPYFHATLDATRTFTLKGSPGGWDFIARARLSTQFRPGHTLGSIIFREVVTGAGVPTNDLSVSLNQMDLSTTDSGFVALHLPSDGLYTIHAHLVIDGYKDLAGSPDHSLEGLDWTIMDTSAVAVPEPPSGRLLALGTSTLAAVALVRRRARRG